jgi:hypothetical protein
MEIGISPGSTHPQTKKELNYTLKLVTPGRTFLKMSRTHSDFIVTPGRTFLKMSRTHSDFIVTPGENSSKCQELII